jgi:hypothetical protein
MPCGSEASYAESRVSEFDPTVAVMRRFRSHAVIVAIIVAAIVVILLSHAVRVRLEWGAGGFVLGLIAAAAVVLDTRHHRERHDK